MRKALVRICVSVARMLILLWCIVIELSFSRNFWKDADLSLYVIFNALSCIRFILLLRLRLWNTQTNGQYLNCDSIKAFTIILFLSTFMKGARRTRALGFLHAFLLRLLSDYWHIGGKPIAVLMVWNTSLSKFLSRLTFMLTIILYGSMVN